MRLYMHVLVAVDMQVMTLMSPGHSEYRSITKQQQQMAHKTTYLRASSLLTAIE